jgi:hypothetical protein
MSAIPEHARRYHVEANKIVAREISARVFEKLKDVGMVFHFDQLTIKGAIFDVVLEVLQDGVEV